MEVPAARSSLRGVAHRATDGFFFNLSWGPGVMSVLSDLFQIGAREALMVWAWSSHGSGLGRLGPVPGIHDTILAPAIGSLVPAGA